jgi:hypothetical protein
MQWHTTYEAMELVKQRQAELHRDAEMHRLVKAAREQQRQAEHSEQQEPRSRRLVRALTHLHIPAK